MAFNPPHNISSNIDPRIFPTLKEAMPALLHPTPNSSLTSSLPLLIRALDKATPMARPDARGCLHAALWLLADDLPQAHILCQDIPTAHGSAWHAFLHRREGDFSNSKYWWRRAQGLTWKAPNSLPLHTQVPALLPDAPWEFSQWKQELQRQYDPTRFVDLVEQHGQTGDATILAALQEVQRAEWATLFLQCFQAAGGM